MMRILYLVPHVPNPTKSRSNFQIHGLREAGHQITVATLRRSSQDEQYIRKLQQADVTVISVPLPKTQVLGNVTRAGLSGLPLQAKFMWSNRLMEAIESYLQTNPVDVVHTEHLRMAQYGLRLQENWPTLWDAVDHLASLYEQAQTSSASRRWQWVSYYEAPRLKHYEAALVTKFPLTTVISAEDQRLFSKSNPDYAERVRIARHGIRLIPVDQSIRRDSDTLVITGSMNYHPNVASIHYFVNEIFPLILQQRPNVTLQIIGANPEPSIQALKSTNIVVTGFVPSVIDHLSKASVAIAPTQYGSGVQTKVLEALVTETPLVATSRALRGLDARNGEHLLVANTPAEFAEAVLQLLSNPELRGRLSAAGRQYIEQNHDLQNTTEHLTNLYREVIEVHKH